MVAGVTSMDSITSLLLLSFILCSLLLLQRRRRRRWNLPPGPTPLPIIGNILQLGQDPHRRLAKLAKTYGPLMYLKLGSIHTVVASSPETAKEILQKHDQTCSGRAVPQVAHAMDHHEFSMAWLPVGAKWRKLRKISREQIFTQHKMEASEGLRQEKLQQLRDYLQGCCSASEMVNFEEASFVVVLNLISATLFSVDFARFDSDSSHQEIKEIVQGAMKLAGTPNMVDFFPVFGFLDPQGLSRRSKAYLAMLLHKFDDIIAIRFDERAESSSRKTDLLEVLLDLNQSDNDSGFTLDDVKHLLLDLFVAGTDTTTDSVQWAMAELLRNPEKMKKAKNELTTVIGDDNQVRESDIPKLPYLRAVIKESFRRHPPGPFLIPHKAEVDVEVNGYTIPRGAQILVNVWAIGRDPTVWSDPDSFQPERFLGSKMDYRGQDFELIPFSSGRRICPGLPLAHLMVHLMVASMIHNFDWRLEPGMKPEDVDLNDVFGLSLHKAVPLKAYPLRHTLPLSLFNNPSCKKYIN